MGILKEMLRGVRGSMVDFSSEKSVELIFFTRDDFYWKRGLRKEPFPKIVFKKTFLIHIESFNVKESNIGSAIC